jgi:uncharacterized phage infection (PIP) family protein YhgE
MKNTPSQRGSFADAATTPKASSLNHAKEAATVDVEELSESATGVSGDVTEKASKLVDNAKDLASQAGEKLNEAAQEQRTAGANFASAMAGAVRRAANEFDPEVPQLADYIRQAADQIDTASDAFRRRDLTDVIAQVQDFARRQPTAFFGASVLAGFAIARFFKSSTQGQGAGSSGLTRSPAQPPQGGSQTGRYSGA